VNKINDISDQFCQCVFVLGTFCVIVNLRLLPTAIKITGIVWKACHDETRQSCSFSTFAWLENNYLGTGHNKNTTYVKPKVAVSSGTKLVFLLLYL